MNSEYDELIEKKEHYELVLKTFDNPPFKINGWHVQIGQMHYGDPLEIDLPLPEARVVIKMCMDELDKQIKDLKCRK